MPPPPPHQLQTIHIESIPQAKKLAERLCHFGYWFTCQYSSPHSGRWFTFSSEVDFERNAGLFKGVVYSIGEGKPHYTKESPNV